MAIAAIDGARLLARLDAFARIGATPGGGVNRPALGPADRKARALLAELGVRRGFALAQDAVANFFLRRPGREDSLPPILIGSHLDSQPTGGRFDGALGTLAALEVLEAIEDAGLETRRPIELVAWTNEEGSRLAPGTMGSTAFREGAIPPAWLKTQGSDGAVMADELADTLASLPQAASRALGTPVAGYIELHIEQGPALEAARLPIGIVTAIQGTRWLEVTISGQTAHAGTTELAYRRDALAVATSILGDLYRTVMPGDPVARFTVGRIATRPGSINAIPGEASFTVDIRHPEIEPLDRLEAGIVRLCEEHAARGGCTATIARRFAMPPTRFDDGMVALLAAQAQNLGLGHRRMVSGAFHDALNMAAIAPAAMIFVPCRDGLSHNEAEYVEQDHCIAGARLLLAATLEAANAD